MIGEFCTLENVITLLQKCKQQKSVEQARFVYSLLCEQELEAHPVVGSYLITALVKCGSLCDAHHVFDRLPYQDEHAWSSLISGYVDSGKPLHAFHLYRIMQHDPHAHPSKYTYLALLRACSRLKDPDPCHCIHGSLILEGLDEDLFVGNTLLDVYAKCGVLTEARHVFNMLPARDVVSCNALIAGYANCGCFEDGLGCLGQMQVESISPDDVTFICALKLCSGTRSIGKCQVLHVDIIKRGLECDLFVGNALVCAYAKCDSLEEAHHLLNKLYVRDVVSWNALMTGYAESGYGEQVLSCLEKMQQEGIVPDDATVVCSLKACTVVRALGRGLEIHSAVVKMGLEQEAHVTNTLVDMYTKCGSLADASKLVYQCSRQDLIAWTVLITGHVERGLYDGALNCFDQMQLQGISPDSNTLVFCLQACCHTESIKRGQLLCIEIAKKGLEANLFVGSAVVDMYAKCGLLVEAKETLNRLPGRNVVCWTALIWGYTEHGYCEEALNCFKQMQVENIFPVAFTYACSLKACGIIQTLEKGRNMHVEVVKRGLEGELYVGNTLVDMYAKVGCLYEAQKIFNVLPIRNVVAWTALIAGYAEGELDEQVLECFEQMQSEGVTADAVTIIHCLKACGATGALVKGREIHAEMRKAGLEGNLILGNTLIDMYGKCGSPVEAQEVFNKLSVRDVVSWNALITAYGENHKGNMAVQCFEDMQELGMKPDIATFTCLLIACSHASLVNEGRNYFRVMSEEHEIHPTPHHYSCMVDLLARSGNVFEAWRFIEAMQSPPSKEILIALLTACKNYGEVQLGERCFEQLVQESQEDAAPYLLMADIYASSGRWMDVHRVEELRNLTKAVKKHAIAANSTHTLI